MGTDICFPCCIKNAPKLWQCHRWYPFVLLFFSEHLFALRMNSTVIPKLPMLSSLVEQAFLGIQGPNPTCPRNGNLAPEALGVPSQVVPFEIPQACISTDGKTLFPTSRRVPWDSLDGISPDSGIFWHSFVIRDTCGFLLGRQASTLTLPRPRTTEA